MFELGKYQELYVVKKMDHGVYLSEEMPEDNTRNRSLFKDDEKKRVLLPIKQVPAGTEIGQKLKIFLYMDSSDRLIATVNEPKITLGEVKLLNVAQVGRVGAFVNWGLEKDLLLPFKEQTKKVNQGEDCLVALYIDKSGRLCLTMNVYEYLDCNSPYNKGDNVSGRVYQTSDNFGAFVAVDDKYSALIPKKELYGDIKIGKIINARVVDVREDGKLTLSVRDKAYLQMDKDAEKVMAVIEEFDGVLPFNDKAAPEVIKREFNMSKNEFKRAVGRLYKDRRIEITEKSIKKLR